MNFFDIIERISQLSKVLFLPAFLFYLFGFLSVTSYYAQFGIVSFDILNTRFLVAGFFPVLAFVAALYLSWVFIKFLPRKHFFRFNSWPELFQRPLAYLFFISTTSATASILKIMFTLGGFSALQDEGILTYRFRFSGYDFIPDFLNKITIESPSLDFIFKLTLHLFFYFLLSVMIIVLLLIVRKWFKGLLSFFKKDNTGISTEAKVSSSVQVTPAEFIDSSLKENPVFRVIAILVDAGSLIFVGSVMVFSFLKIHASILNFNALDSLPLLSTGLVAAWLLMMEFCVMLFFAFKMPSLGFVDFQNLWKNIEDPQEIHHLFQILLIPNLVLLLIFGVTIFPRIPYSIGGGQPREVRIIFNEVDNVPHFDKYFLIGENTEFFFVVGLSNERQLAPLQISKSIINFIETKPNPSDLESGV